MNETRSRGRKTGRLLLAEDDLLLAATLVEFLRADGHIVTAAPDGAAALAASEGLEFDVLLTDLRMPVMDGMALIRALRARRPDLPVVVMSGDVPVDWRSAIGIDNNNAGKIELVRKPMSLAQLRNALASVWSGGVLPELLLPIAVELPVARAGGVASTAAGSVSADALSSEPSYEALRVLP